MPDFVFNEQNRIEFQTKYHGLISLSKVKWEEICQEPERFYYRDNAEKVSTTLINPDYVRYSHNHENQFIYYKRFDTFKLGNKEVDSFVKFWAVIIDCITCRVCTIYPTFTLKKGKEYTGENKNEK